MENLEVEENMLLDNTYRGKRVLVTGNTGFKGAWLTTWLLDLGAKVYGFSDAIFDEPNMFSELKLENKIQHIKGDIRDLNLVEEVFKTVAPDFVFHLAAQSIVSLSYEDPNLTYSTNVLGTLNVLEALRSMNHKCSAVLITSDKCYHNVEWNWGYRETDSLGGKDHYSASKAAAEILIHASFKSFFDREDSIVRLASTRAGNVVGGGDWKKDRIVPDAIRAWSENRSVIIRAPNSTRPWQHVLEPLSGYLLVGSALARGYKISGESYNFGPRANQNKTVNELLMELAKTWAPIGSEPIDVKEDLNFKEAGLLKLNCDKALADLQWEPVLEFEECGLLTASWYQTFYEKNSDMFEYTKKQISSYISRAKERGLEWAK